MPSSGSCGSLRLGKLHIGQLLHQRGKCPKTPDTNFVVSKALSEKF